MKQQLAEAVADAAGLVVSADILAAKGEYERALAMYREALASDPLHPTAGHHLALILGATGQHDEAIGILTGILARAPSDADARGLLADSLRTVGQIAEAAAQYRQILDENPQSPDALRSLGVCQLALDDTAAGRQSLRQVLVQQPNDPEANFHLGGSFYDTGDYRQAIEHFQRGMEMSEAPSIHAALAEAFRCAGRVDEALATAQALVARHPDYAHGWHTYGVIQMGLEEHRAAADTFRRAIELDPGHGLSIFNLGLCLRQLLDLENALACFEAAKDKLPATLDLLIHQSEVLLALERHEEALPLLSELVQHVPESAGSWNNLAVALLYSQRHDEAEDAYRRALALEPELPAANLGLVSCLANMGRKPEASRHLSATLHLVADNTRNIATAGGLLESLDLHEQAADLYRRIPDGAPEYDRAQARLFDLTLSLCDWRDYDERVGALTAQLARQIETGERIAFDVFNLQALSVSFDFIANAAANRANAIAQDVQIQRARAPFAHDRPAGRPGRKIRLAYLLPYTHFHSLPLVLKNIVANHDRDRFEVLGYCIQRCPGSPFSRVYRGSFDRFVDLPSTNAHRAAATIRDDGVDVLIDVAGLTSTNCMPIMSLRPAPVQAHYLGYSITTGADYIDYIITDRTYIPPQWQHLCCEKLVYLPDTFMATVRQPIADHRPSRAELGLPADAFVFCNFNHPCKFEPTIFQAWVDILRHVPNAVMWFGNWANATQRNLQREADRRGIDPNRLLFAEIVSHDQHCARLTQADLALDNLYHGGGITTVDALWSGLPILTMAGATPSARLGATLARAAGMPELIVDDLKSYTEMAIALANQPDRLAGLRARLAAKRDDCALFDTERYRQNLEAAYQAMWAVHEAGEAPRPIDLADQASDK